MTYATMWARCWSLVGALGVGLSFLAWRPLSVLTVFLTAAACAVVLLALFAPAPPHTTPLAWRLGRIGTRAGLSGAAVVALGGLSAVLPALALPLVLAAVVSHPACVDQVTRWRSAGTQAQPTRPLVMDGPRPVEADRVAAGATWPGPAGCRLDIDAGAAEQLTDQELCLQWRHSFLTLQSAPCAQDLGRVVVQRQILLDEMERRSPLALQAWLASGARAAGGPERFLGGQPHDDQPDAA